MFASSIGRSYEMDHWGLNHSPPNFTPSSYELSGFKRTRSGSISRRMRSASDLEEKGLIDRSQKGALKDLIIRGDEHLLNALDRWTTEGDHSELESLIRSGALDEAAAMAALDVDVLVDDLEFNFLQLQSGDAPVPSAPVPVPGAVPMPKPEIDSEAAGAAPELTVGSYQFDLDELPFEASFGDPDDGMGPLSLGKIGFGISPLDPAALELALSPLMMIKEEGVEPPPVQTQAPQPEAPLSIPHVVTEQQPPMQPFLVDVKLENQPQFIPNLSALLTANSDPQSQLNSGGIARSACIDIPKAGGQAGRLGSMPMPMMPPPPVVKLQAPASTVPPAVTAAGAGLMRPPVQTGLAVPAVADIRAVKTEAPPVATKPLMVPTTHDTTAGSDATNGRHYVGAYSPESRRRRLERFWEKKKNRIWQRKVKYDVRKEFAESRIRVKGRFVKKEDEAILTSLLGVVPPPLDAAGL